MKHLALSLMMGLLSFATLTLADVENAQPAAVTAVRAWLALTDSGKFDESWNEAAQFFQQRISQKKWATEIATVRTPLGRLQTRSLVSATPMSSLPGAPPGEYVVIRFNASFEKKDAAVETLTTAKDPSGKWKVAGYFIR
jgi:hypothetical protein